MAVQNRIVRITRVGGIIGAFKGTTNQTDKQVQQLNAEGFEVVQLILKHRGFFGPMVSDSFGKSFKAMLLLMVTLGFYTKSIVAVIVAKKVA